MAWKFVLIASLVPTVVTVLMRQWLCDRVLSSCRTGATRRTGRELAEFLGEVAENQLGRPIDQISGPREARGASIGGSQVHSIRLPSFVLSFETIFGLPNERLSIRHDSGSGAEPYVNGTLMAAARVVSMTGLVRGLDTLLFGEAK